jgi:hypothetical protein
MVSYGAMKQINKLFSVGAATLMVAGSGWSATNVVMGEDIVVQAPKSDVDVFQGGAVASTLDRVPGLAVVSQGVADGQADLQIQGSAFSGAGVALAGLSLGNAQTEHFNAELPVDPFLLGQPLVLGGVDQLRASDGFLVGSVALDFVPLGDESSYLSIGTDEHGGHWLSGALRDYVTIDSVAAAGTVYGSVRDLPDVDNLGNDLASWRAGMLLQGGMDDGALDLLLAYGEKEFGATGYYGVNPEWAAEEKTEDALILGRYGWTGESGSQGQFAASWRRFRDDYRLDLPSGALYRNEHRTDTYNLSLSEMRPWGDASSLDWRVSSTTERIRSSNLGDHRRTRFNGLLLPGTEIGRWRFAAGVHGVVFEESESLLPLAEVSVQLVEAWSLALSYAESEREPSYTELNYESPASLGNAGLQNQTAQTTSLVLAGPLAKSLSVRGSVFYRDENDSVDWVRETSESARWTATNLDGVSTVGADLFLDWRPVKALQAGLWFQGLDKEADSSPYSSRYVLDYAEYLAQLNLLWRAAPWMEFECVQQYRRQAENPLREDRDGLLGRLAVHLLLPSRLAPRITLDVTNPWDDDLELFPGQATYAPRRVSLSLSTAW